MKRGQKRTSRSGTWLRIPARFEEALDERDDVLCLWHIVSGEDDATPPGMRPPPCALDDEMLLRTEAVLPARRPSLTLMAAFLPLLLDDFEWIGSLACYAALQGVSSPFYRGDAQVATQVCGRRIVDRSERSVIALVFCRSVATASRSGGHHVTWLRGRLVGQESCGDWQSVHYDGRMEELT